MILDCPNHVVDIKAQAFRLNHKLFYFSLKEALPVAPSRMWCLSDYSANPWTGFEPAFLD